MMTLDVGNQDKRDGSILKEQLIKKNNLKLREQKKKPHQNSALVSLNVQHCEKININFCKRYVHLLRAKKYFRYNYYGKERDSCFHYFID